MDNFGHMIQLSIDFVNFCPRLLLKGESLPYTGNDNELQYRSSEHYRSVISILSGVGCLGWESRECVGRRIPFKQTDNISGLIRLSIDFIDFLTDYLSGNCCHIVLADR